MINIIHCHIVFSEYARVHCHEMIVWKWIYQKTSVKTNESVTFPAVIQDISLKQKLGRRSK